MTPLTIPPCTLLSRLCAQCRSVTSTPHAPATGAIVQHHRIAQGWRATPREGRQMAQSQGGQQRGWKASPPGAPVSPARDSLSPERGLPCLPSHTLAPRLDDGLFFLALRVLLAE